MTQDDRSAVANAVRLLGGSNDEVLKGIALIDAAAAEGNAEALERKALFEALGCGRPQDWDRALDCLQEAAARGSAAAQDQLLVLAGDQPGPVREETDWTLIRAQISVEKLINVPPKKAISESPRLRAIDKFASAAECEWLIKRARDRLRPAAVVNVTGSLSIEADRTNSAVEFQMVDMDLVIEAVRLRISAATRLLLPLFEPSQVFHYAAGQEFKPHHDYFDPGNAGHAEQLKMGQRIATFLIYLNDEYTGGETIFPRAHISFRGKAGDAFFFANVERSGQPDPLTLHSGTPPTSGEKWIFSQWIRDKLPPAPVPGQS